MEYIYDGTFDGMLTCFFAHVYVEPAEAIIAESDAGQLGFARRQLIVTDRSKADRVSAAIEKKLSRQSLRRCYKAFLCGESGREMDVLRYVFKGFKTGPCIDMLHGDPDVRRIDVLERKVNWELDRFLGILRFSVVCPEDGVEILYAEYAPNCDITQLMMPHFLNRYRREAFVIHDVKREKAAFAGRGRWVMRPLPKTFSPRFSKDEEAYRNLWRGYFTAAAIKERLNPDLQKSFIPTRYWEYLTESPERNDPRP